MGSESAQRAATFVLLLLVILGTSSVVDADCSNDAITQLTPCDAAVMPGASTPTAQCCGVLNSWGLPCLCTVISQYGSAPPASVDMQKVLAMPASCDMAGASGYTCDGYTFT